MLKLIPRIFKAIYTGRIIYILMNMISVPLMRKGKLSISLWLVRHTQKEKSVENYPYQSVVSWVNQYGEMQKIYDERPLTLYPVRSVGYQCQQDGMHAHTHTVLLPAISYNALEQVEVIGGSEMLFTKDGSALYDELAQGDVERYGVKAYRIIPHNYYGSYLPSATKHHFQCLFQFSSPPQGVACAISLLKDHSRNYYHWLLECLPRAVLAFRKQAWESYPLLIDQGLAPQLVESLRLLAPARELIEIPAGVRVHVEKLFFPSILSPTHDYYGKVPRVEDFLIAPEAIVLLRDALLPHVLKNMVGLNHPYIYVARSGGKNRTIRNEVEVIRAVKEMGFVVVYPGELTFLEQVTLFSNAKIVIGPTGAGMANIIFAKTDCKIAVLAAATRNANYYLFAQLAQYVGQEITYICGKPADPYQLHSDYAIDVIALRNLLAEYLATISAVNIVENLQREN